MSARRQLTTEPTAPRRRRVWECDGRPRCPSRVVSWSQCAWHGAGRAARPLPACASQPEHAQAPSDQSDSSLAACTRRQAVCATLLASSLPLVSSAGAPPPAHASKLPVFADSIWEAMGGGPADLTFPEWFLGVWDVTSTLVQIDTPLGESKVPDMAVLRRAMDQDLNTPIGYQVAFIRSPRDGRVIFDRAFNTAAMLSHYLRKPTSDLISRVAWNPSDPNILTLTVPGGMSVRTRVTRRSQQQPAPDRLETSEFIEQVYDTSEMNESQGVTPRVKASQCFTKFRWRDESLTAAGQPAIVATQVVSDYLTGLGDPQAYMEAGNRPVTMYTYRMSFVRSSRNSA